MKVFAASIRVKKGKIEEARRFFRTFVEPSRAEPGCIQYDLFQGAEDPQLFCFFEKWKDDDAFKRHGSQPFLAEFQSRAEELLEEPNRFLQLVPIETR